MRKSHICLLALCTFVSCHIGVCANTENALFKVVRFPSTSTVEISHCDQIATLGVGDRLAEWTFMGETTGTQQSAILEDFTHPTGHLLVVDTRGVRLDLPKSLEPTSQDPARLYLGYTLDEIKNSASDLLADRILSEANDPEYDEVASVFPPIRKMPTYSFVGTNQTMDKVGFAYGGRTPNFDPAPYAPSIYQIREQGRVWDGLVGGYLPILRFVYPETPDNWTEMIAFAPLRISNGNDRVQPVWYRLVHIEHGSLKWAHYINSYHPFPPRTEDDPMLFYRDLLGLNEGWRSVLAAGMQVHLPDERLENMARFALVRDLMTRVGAFPKYGAVDKDYGGSEHDGFPDTFNVDTTAMLDWGLLDVAARYIDNYFGKFVRDDGSILYRGPEIGQYGRMLTVIAQFVNYGGSPSLVFKHRGRIDGVTKLLLALRKKAKQLPKDDAAYGMIAGWSEADACLDPEPTRYMQPYFSNSTEAARGFQDLGEVWIRIGEQRKNEELVAWGERLVREAQDLRSDIQKAIARSLLRVDGETILPSIAGVKEPFHIAAQRDRADPQFRSYRAYMEMMYSGILTGDQVKLIVEYRRKHHDTILGVPTAYGFNTGDMAGFLSYGHGFGLIQHDMIREALLMMYSTMAHQYTRGTWTAPETRSVFDDGPAAPYCTPAQLVVSMMTRWVLVFDDPVSNTLWLGKAIPRKWFEDGKVISVSAAPTTWGRVGFSLVSRLNQGKIEATLDLPPNRGAITKLRLRTPGHRRLESILLNGKRWFDYSRAEETVTIPADISGVVRIVAEYDP